MVESSKMQESKRINEVTLPPITRRIAAALLDIFFVVIIFLTLVSLVLPPIVEKVVHFSELKENYRVRLLDSHLYEELNKTTYRLTELYSEQEKKEKSEEYFAKLDGNITYFYTQFTDFEDAKIENYTKSKEESNLFVYDEESQVWNVSGKATYAELLKFYEIEYEKALNYLSLDSLCLEYARKISITTIVEAIIGLTIPLVIFYLVIPLILKERKTLGKKFVGLAVVSRKNGFVATRTQILIRFLAFYFIEVILSIFLFGIPLLISFTLVCFSKERNAIHDYLSATLVVDTRQIPVFKDEEEYKNYYQVEMEEEK